MCYACVSSPRARSSPRPPSPVAAATKEMDLVSREVAEIYHHLPLLEVRYQEAAGARKMTPAHGLEQRLDKVERTRGQRIQHPR
jgi:hypothetical protein